MLDSMAVLRILRLTGWERIFFPGQYIACNPAKTVPEP